MIDRYRLAAMDDVLNERARLSRWLEVELCVLDAWAELGLISQEVSDRVRHRMPAVDETFCERVQDREAEVRHDVAAFVDVIEQDGGEDGRWLHYGITSSDVVDTAQALALGEAADLIGQRGLALFAELRGLATTHRSTVTIGRTHGVHAEPTTLGRRFGLLAMALSRALEQLHQESLRVRVGKVSGAVGAYSTVDPQVEAIVCRTLGLEPIAASQVVPRDIHAAFGFALARVATTVETFALQVRLGHQTEISEVLEGFAAEQKGSSAMPHKKNPATAEQLCGIGRLARTLQSPLLENASLWHDRDLTHSSVERVALTDLCYLTHYAVVTATTLARNLVVDVASIAANLALAAHATDSQPLLLHLIRTGQSRNEAYRQVRDALDQAATQTIDLTSAAQALGLDVPALAPLDPTEHDAQLFDQLDSCWAARSAS